MTTRCYQTVAHTSPYEIDGDGLEDKMESEWTDVFKFRELSILL